MYWGLKSASRKSIVRNTWTKRQGRHTNYYEEKVNSKKYFFLWNDYIYKGDWNHNNQIILWLVLNHSKIRFQQLSNSEMLCSWGHETSYVKLTNPPSYITQDSAHITKYGLPFQVLLTKFNTLLYYAKEAPRIHVLRTRACFKEIHLPEHMDGAPGTSQVLSGWIQYFYVIIIVLRGIKT